MDPSTRVLGGLLCAAAMLACADRGELAVGTGVALGQSPARAAPPARRTQRTDPGDGPHAQALAAIQGRGHRSPFAGRRVETGGVVTAVDADPRRPGFWIQEGPPDREWATTEGLRVDTTGVPSLAPGDRVTVTGRVEEGPERRAELTVTRLAGASWRVIESGLPLPAPVVLAAPAGGHGGNEADGAARVVPSAHVDDDRLGRFEPERDALDFFESLEGMRVEIRGPVVVGPTNGFREWVVLAGDGAGSELRSWRGGLVARPGDDDAERVLVDPRLLEGAPPRVVVGDRFAGPLVGVLDYAFGSYRVLLTEPPPRVERRTAARDRTALRSSADQLTVATWNVLDLGGDDDGGVFRSIARGVVEDLGSPDLVALQEISDASGRRDDGVVDGAPTLRRLVAAIRDGGGPEYRFLQIDPRDGGDGGPPGANIRVALLHQPGRVSAILRGSGDAAAVAEVVPGPALSSSPGLVAPGDEAWRDSRKPLAVELRFSGRPLFVIVNHLASKLGDDPLFGAVQPPVPWSERQRGEQAERVAALAKSLLAADPQSAVIVLGDLNEHWYGAALAPLREAGLVSLIERVPLPERYTYNYRGHSQVLDHLFVSAALAAGAQVDVVHTNADFPAWRRSSDHDAVVARLRAPAAGQR